MNTKTAVLAFGKHLLTTIGLSAASILTVESANALGNLNVSHLPIPAQGIAYLAIPAVVGALQRLNIQIKEQNK